MLSFIIILDGDIMLVNSDSSKKQKKIFAKNFRLFMEKSGKSQADVAKDLNVTSSTISDWANAKKYPRVDKMQALADYFGILLSDLREEKKDSTENGIPEDVFNLLKSLSQEDLDIVLSFAKMMRQKEIEREQ